MAASPPRGDRMLDDPADVLGLETETGHQRLFSISAFGPGFFLWRRAVRLITLTEARSAADARVANAPGMTVPEALGSPVARGGSAVQPGHRHSPTSTDSRRVRDKCADHR